MPTNQIQQPADTAQKPALPRVLIATTAMLAFVSFWRAAAIVLNDMGSSAFYAGAIAEHFIGKTGPWFILAIMILAYAVRSLYIESCSMFVRGGVYRVVKEAMGSTLAKISVSALMFDYILTGPISGVSADLYLVGEHQGHSRVQRESAAHHVRHHGNGCAHDRLVRLYAVHERRSPSAS